MMLLRARTLAMGCSGVRPVVAETIARRCSTPGIDAGRARARLARRQRRPRAARALRAGADRRGRGRRRRRRAGRRPQALAAAGIEPVTLGAKEGLALINGTDGMLGHAACSRCADLDALLRSRRRRRRDDASRRCWAPTAPSPPTCMALRPQPGQARQRRQPARAAGGLADRRQPPRTATRACRTPTRCAARRRCTAPRATRSSYAARGRRRRARRRRSTTRWCCPTAGSSRAATSTARRSAFACDFLAIAAAEVGAIAERRTDRLLDAHPLARACRRSSPTTPGVNSGLMIAQYTQAAMVAENRRLAAPASVDSLPTSAMQEDHVSMGWGAARKLRAVARQPRGGSSPSSWSARPAALDLRAPLQPGAGTGAALRRAARRGVAGAGPDRWLAPELRARPRSWSRRGALLGAVEAVDRDAAAMSGATTPARSARRAGTELTCRGWPQEAAMRMLMNNLDPEVAERPDDLVVYGGTGRAARSWEAFDAIVRTLRDARRRRDAARPVGQAGRRVPHPRVGAARADRQLEPGAASGRTGTSSAGSRRSGLTMYGQMTAGSWIYIGTPGDPAGHLRVLRRDRAARASAARWPGTITLTAGLGGMGGAQPLAVTMNGGVALCVEVDPRAHRAPRSRRATSTRWPTTSTTRSRAARAAKRRAPARCQRRARRQRRRRRARAARGAASRPTSSPTRRAPTTR